MLLKSQGRSIVKSLLSARTKGRAFGIIGVLLTLIFGIGLTLRSDHNLHEKAANSLFELSSFLLSVYHEPVTLITDTKKSLSNLSLLRENTSLLKDLEIKNKTLKNINQTLELRIQNLQNILHVKTLSNKDTITLPCFGQHSSQKSGMIFVHASPEFGLKKTQPVTAHGALIGLIDHVSTNTTRIMLLTHHRCRIPITSRQTDQEGILSATSPYQLTIQFAAKPKTFKIGEAIYTSGTDGILPRGLLIGHVASVSESNVIVNPAVDTTLIKYVHVDTSVNASSERDKHVEAGS